MTEISLLAAFIAGIVALFAPCCITYLFPAYIGNVFKERHKVLSMTFIYSLGIFSIMLPIVLGASFLSNFFMKFHDQTYLIGGIVMLFVSIITFFGFKLPMPHIALKQSNKNDIVSTYTLGLISGVTSACCAPVLIGVITLSSLSFSVINSVLVGIFFVLGMVSPLYIASLFIDKSNFLENPLLKKRLLTISLFNTSYPIFISNIIGSLTFFGTGILILSLTMMGELSMGEEELAITKQINQVALAVSEITTAYPIVSIIFITLIISLIVYFTKSVFHQDSNQEAKKGKDCCKQS